MDMVQFLHNAAQPERPDAGSNPIHYVQVFVQRKPRSYVSTNASVSNRYDLTCGKLTKSSILLLPTLLIYCEETVCNYTIACTLSDLSLASILAQILGRFKPRDREKNQTKPNQPNPVVDPTAVHLRGRLE